MVSGEGSWGSIFIPMCETRGAKFLTVCNHTAVWKIFSSVGHGVCLAVLFLDLILTLVRCV